VKYSNPKHPGYASLTDSLDSVRKVADFVNEEKKNAENSLKMLQIQENLVGKRARVSIFFLPLLQFIFCFLYSLFWSPRESFSVKVLLLG
jgi:hypothetical protein